MSEGRVPVRKIEKHDRKWFTHLVTTSCIVSVRKKTTVKHGDVHLLEVEVPPEARKLLIQMNR